MPELLLPRLKREIDARLAELRPVMAEVEQLEAALAALLDERALAPTRRFSAPQRLEGGHASEPERVVPEPAEPATAPPEPAPERAPEPEPAPTPALEPRRDAVAPSREPAGGPPAAPSNPTRDAILAIVEERPGVSVAEIVAVTKLAKPSVASTVAKLKREGVLADEAGGVKLASRKPITLAAIAGAGTRDGGVSDAEWNAARPRAGRARARS
jgi:hypothetical protein